MTLSIAIATHNEEKNIIRCLKSVYDWVKEIVVVDGTSTDKTVDLIKNFDKEHKIKIFLENNPAMFHINKQKAIERCSSDWILQLDADEVVSEELKKEIKSVISNQLSVISKKQKKLTTDNRKLNTTVAYWLPRLNFFLGRPLRKGGQYPDYTIRLYRNGVAKFPCKSVHEQVEISNQLSVISGQPKTKKLITDNWKLRAENCIGYLNSPLLHYPYPSFSEYINKWNRYTSQEAEILKKQGVKPSVLNFIKYFFILPKCWFFKTYFRHLGFLDGFPGFIFSLFSAVRYWGIYVKLINR